MPDTKGANTSKSRQSFCPLVPKKLLANFCYFYVKKRDLLLLLLSLLLLYKGDISKKAYKLPDYDNV